MTTDLATVPRSDLAIGTNQTFWTQKQAAALKQLGVDEATNADLAVFFHQVTRTGLDPFARQIYMIKRDGKQTIQTGIDGFRLIARRAVDRSDERLGYEDTLWCGKDAVWSSVWLSEEAPAAAKVTVLRNGERFPAVALYSEYAVVKTDGSINKMWRTKGALMLAKCAEALALRKAFPQDLSGVYTSDEMASEPPTNVNFGTGEVVEATVVEDPSMSVPVEGSVSFQAATEAQLNEMKRLMDKLELEGREGRLDYVMKVIGVDIESSDDLSASQAVDVINQLRSDGDIG